MNETAYPQVDAAQLAQAQKLAALKRQHTSGVGWFYWIAGLSVINTVIYIAGGSMTFIIGLGLTQMVDGLANVLAKSQVTDVANLMRGVGLFLDVVIALIFVLYGVLGTRKVRWAVIAGMILYALDGVIYVTVSEWAAVAFHLLALWSLWRGVLAMNKLLALESPLTSSTGALSPYPQVSAIEVMDHRPSANLVLNVFAILGTLLLVVLTIGALVLLLVG